MRKTLPTNDYKLLKQLFMIREEALLHSLSNILNHYYDRVITTHDYIYALGDIPVGLVAHLDTVHKRVVQNLYHDEKEKVLWSPEGLGADDRAGVFAILKIIEKGYRPSILLCTKEESGGLGATKLVQDHPTPKIKTNFLIELDRQGIDDSVYYNFDNEKFENYINSYEFQTQWGTFSDISIISPAWRLPAVNLSIGYIDEHSLAEILYYPAMYDTIRKVIKILEAESAEDHIFEYKYRDLYMKLFQQQHGLRCDFCGISEKIEALIPVTDEEVTFHFCSECAKGVVEWCTRCGRSYIKYDYDESTICETCKTKEQIN